MNSLDQRFLLFFVMPICANLMKNHIKFLNKLLPLLNTPKIIQSFGVQVQNKSHLILDKKKNHDFN